MPVFAALPFTFSTCTPDKKDGGIYRSTDTMTNWTQIITIEGSEENLSKSNTRKILSDPFNPNVVFLCTQNEGLFVSNNFGESWKRIISETSQVYDIEAQRSRQGTFYLSAVLGTRGKILKTENGGTDWTEIYTETGSNTYIEHIKSDPHLDNSLISVNSKGLLTRSTNGGNTWQATYPFPERIIDISFDPAQNEKIWAIDSQGIWKSEDGGYSFNRLETGEFGEIGQSFYLIKKTENSLYLSTDNGLFRSSNEGNSWQKIVTLNNPTDFPTRVLTVFPRSNGNALAIGAGMTLYVTSDGGENWKPIQFDISRIISSILVKEDDLNQVLVGVAENRQNQFYPF